MAMMAMMGEMGGVFLCEILSADRGPDFAISFAGEWDLRLIPCDDLK